MSRLCPARPKPPSNSFILDKRSQEAILAIGLYELQSNLQYKFKIMPYLIDVLQGLPNAKWIEPRMNVLSARSSMAGEFALCFVNLMSNLAGRDNQLAMKINGCVMDVFGALLKRCSSYKELKTLEAKGT
jgi:phosphatidylinositol 4-kinase